MTTTPLTEQAFWDQYWDSTHSVQEIKKTTAGPLVREILLLLERHLPVNPDWTVAEIGGAPGQYLAYMQRTFGYSAHALDYSAVGCAKMAENFANLQLPVQIHQQDLFAADLDKLGPYDVVYSLGFIEHFDNTNAVVAHHLQLLRPGGFLVLGVPNYAGIYRWFWSLMMPEKLALHNLKAMDLAVWRSFEQEFDLEVIFRDYIGGFEPAVMTKYEKSTWSNVALARFFRAFTRRYNTYLGSLRRYNCSWASGYILGIYRKPLAVDPSL